MCGSPPQAPLWEVWGLGVGRSRRVRTIFISALFVGPAFCVVELSRTLLFLIVPILVRFITKKVGGASAILYKQAAQGIHCSALPLCDTSEAQDPALRRRSDTPRSRVAQTRIARASLAHPIGLIRSRITRRSRVARASLSRAALCLRRGASWARWAAWPPRSRC